MASTGSGPTPTVELVEVTDADGNVLLVQMEPTETPTLNPNAPSQATPDPQIGERPLLAGRPTPIPTPSEGIERLVVRTENKGAPLFTAVVRHGPGRWYRVAALLEPASVIEIVLGKIENDDGLWYLIETPAGQRGWIKSEFVDVDDK